MKDTRDAKPPSVRPGAARSRPAKAGSGVTADTFGRFVRNLAKLESGRPQAGKGGKGGEGGR